MTVARTDHQLVPSREARALYSTMVARTDPSTGHITLQQTLKLAAERVEAGKSAREDMGLVQELCRQDWMEAAGDGGWLLGDINPVAAPPP